MAEDDPVNLLGRKILAVGFDPAVGGEMNAPAARRQRQRQRFRGEQVAAGAAGRQQCNVSHSNADQAGLAAGGRAMTRLTIRRGSGRRRVNASSRPMPKATAIIDEPP